MQDLIGKFIFFFRSVRTVDAGAHKLVCFGQDKMHDLIQFGYLLPIRYALGVPRATLEVGNWIITNY